MIETALAASSSATTSPVVAGCPSRSDAKTAWPAWAGMVSACECTRTPGSTASTSSAWWERPGATSGLPSPPAAATRSVRDRAITSDASPTPNAPSTTLSSRTSPVVLQLDARTRVAPNAVPRLAKLETSGPVAASLSPPENTVLTPAAS
jgi:hypothetical protein